MLGIGKVESLSDLYDSLLFIVIVIAMIILIE